MPQGNREAQLLSVRALLGQMEPCHFPEQIFRYLPFLLVFRGQAPGHPEDLPVQVGHPQLQGMGHAHPVRLLQDVPGKPVEQVYVLHAAGFVQAVGIPIVPLQKGLGRGCPCAALEELLPLLRGEKIGVADKTFLQ